MSVISALSPSDTSACSSCASVAASLAGFTPGSTRCHLSNRAASWDMERGAGAVVRASVWAAAAEGVTALLALRRAGLLFIAGLLVLWVFSCLHAKQAKYRPHVSLPCPTRHVFHYIARLGKHEQVKEGGRSGIAVSTTASLHNLALELDGRK